MHMSTTTAPGEWGKGRVTIKKKMSLKAFCPGPLSQPLVKHGKTQEKMRMRFGRSTDECVFA